MAQAFCVICQEKSKHRSIYISAEELGNSWGTYARLLRFTSKWIVKILVRVSVAGLISKRSAEIHCFKASFAGLHYLRRLWVEVLLSLGFCFDLGVFLTPF